MHDVIDDYDDAVCGGVDGPRWHSTWQAELCSSCFFPFLTMMEGAGAGEALQIFW